MNQTAHRRKDSGMKIDDLRYRISRTIERIGAATVVDRQRRGLRISGEVVNRARGVMKTINGVTGPRCRRSVNRVDSIDVRQLWRNHVTVGTAVVIVLGKIRHDRILPSIVGIGRIRGIDCAAIVWALVAESERVTDLVDVSLVPVTIDPGLAVHRAAVGGDPIRADVDGRGTHDARRAIAIALEGRHRAVMIEGDVRRAGRQNEIEIGDFVPSFQRRLRKKLLRRRQTTDVVEDG